MTDPRRIIKLLQITENLLEELYKQCAEWFPEAKADFLLLAGEERGHSLVYDYVLEHFTSHTEQWRVGRFEEKAIQFVHQRIRNTIDEIRSGKCDKRSAIPNALSIEQSLSEQRIDQFLQCDDPEQMKGLHSVAEAFHGHFTRILALQDQLIPNPNRIQF